VPTAAIATNIAVTAFIGTSVVTTSSAGTLAVAALARTCWEPLGLAVGLRPHGAAQQVLLNVAAVVELAL
jgi:hypothetical protein